MVGTIEVVAHIIGLIKKQKYVIIEDIPQSLSLRPEVYSKKGKNKILFYIRKSNSIPEAIVQRISLSKKGNKNIECRVVFCKKPNKTTLFLLSLYGVNAHFFIKNKLSNLLVVPPKQVKKIEPKKEKKRFPSTHIFIGSQQKIEERNITKQYLEDLSKSEKWPLFPICIEYDPRYGVKQTNQCEIDNMDDSDWFIGILAEEYSKEVNKEIRRAVKDKFKVKNTIILVKSNKECRESWKSLISHLEDNTDVKYTPYVDIREFRPVLMRRVMHRVKEIHKQKRIPFMGETLKA